MAASLCLHGSHANLATIDSSAWEISMKRARIFALGIGLLALAGLAIGASVIAAPTAAVAGCSKRC